MWVREGVGVREEEWERGRKRVGVREGGRGCEGRREWE